MFTKSYGSAVYADLRDLVKEACERAEIWLPLQPASSRRRRRRRRKKVISRDFRSDRKGTSSKEERRNSFETPLPLEKIKSKP
ncbi:hypothetical protein KFK09_016518 [Dendrobium nobile]|uniref:Uncharacterized protein n=1 Tax=Dendrobium nobile TaxID=94219 RepID=A0A8T3AYG2_DENNO|nr:hypothetical protein KFK09_016518 [Dendrobium nobile]